MKELLEQIRASISGEYHMGQAWEIDALEGVIPQVEELELFKSEHLRLEAELNAILHPNGDGPTAPSFCDLVAYVRADLEHQKACTQLNLTVPFTPKLCGTCTHDHCGCSIQDSLLQITPDATFDTFGCVHHEKQK